MARRGMRRVIKRMSAATTASDAYSRAAQKAVSAFHEFAEACGRLNVRELFDS